MRLLLSAGVIITVVAALLCNCRPSANVSEQSDAASKSLSPLAAAAKRGDASAVRRLLAAGADPNVADADGATPLQYAASSGKIAVVQALLASGANVRACSPDGSTALHAAVVDREAPIAELLIAAGADVNARTTNNVTPLMASIGSPYSDAKMSLTLMRAGADVNVADSNGETALWVAATTGPDEVFEELLRRGANPNVQARALGFPGYSPLHMAAFSGSTGKVKLLLQYGADPSIRNDTGETPLDITNVRFEQVRQMLENAMQSQEHGR